MNGYVINWHGPYDDYNLYDNKVKNCLYLITGKRKYERNESILYCGITTRTVFDRVNDLNHKSWTVTRNIQYWIGIIEYSRKPSKHLLTKLEHIIINFWKPIGNTQNVNNLPKTKLVLINQWRKIDGKLRVKNVFEAQKLDDIIFFNGNQWIVSEKTKMKLL